MNWDQVKGQWKQIRGSVKEHWGKLTDDDLTQIDGQKEKLIGRLQQRYGIAKEEAERRTDEWLKMQTDLHPAGARHDK